MNKELFIELTPFGARGAILEHGELLEVRFADSEIDDIRGQIFQGRVKTIDKDLDAAFIDCGRGLIAYLSGRDGRWATGRRRDEPLSKQLTEGQTVMVQGIGPRRDGKKPKVTSDVQIGGMFVIFRPKRQSIKFSSRLSDLGQSERLRALAKDVFPDGGAIFRGAAAEASDEDLRTECERLRLIWTEIESQADTMKGAGCLFERKDPLHRVLHDAMRPDIGRVVTSDKVSHVRTRTYLEVWLPHMSERLECMPGAFVVNGVNEQLEQALEERFELKNGGDIIIETTAALTAIDVNSAGRQALETNVDAAKEIARQLRLQRIGGTIVVDFIDLDNRREREALMTALQTAFADDPASVQILPPTPLGLVQISRQRLGKSLREWLQRSCPSCSGSGSVISLAATTERMLGDLCRRGVKPTPARFRTALDLFSYLATEAAEPFREHIRRQGMPTPSFEPDKSLSPGTYRMIEG